LRKAQCARETVPSLIALDLCRLSVNPEPTADLFIELAAGDSPRQIERADSIGITGEISNEWENAFRSQWSRCNASFSVLPSNLSSALELLTDRGFVAHAGNGIIYHDGPPVAAPRFVPHPLAERLKRAFDPFGVMAPLSVLSRAKPEPVTT
jgi:hypothetical protein